VALHMKSKTKRNAIHLARLGNDGSGKEEIWKLIAIAELATRVDRASAKFADQKQKAIIMHRAEAEAEERNDVSSCNYTLAWLHQ
jgi:hypothetical protein